MGAVSLDEQLHHHATAVLLSRVVLRFSLINPSFFPRRPCFSTGIHGQCFPPTESAAPVAVRQAHRHCL